MRTEITASVICAVLFWFINGNQANVEDIAEETQHAVCNITTKDAQTSANASVTRQFRGVCTSKQLVFLFKELETMIQKEFQQIRILLRQPDDINSFTPPPGYSFKAQTIQETDEGNVDIEEILPIFSSHKTTKLAQKNLDQEPVFQKIRTEIFHPKNLNNLLDSTLEKKIKNLNDTVRKEGEKNIYCYFWRVEKFSKLMRRRDMYLASPFFMVLGHELAIQLFPNQPEDFLLLKLRTTKSFIKRHKFSILSRTKGEHLVSPPLGLIPDETDTFSVPLRSLKNFECIQEDSIIIELNVQL